jgi:phosphatidylserine/phosphatidylglycerophosphate/cardiolipin synthase-like enzyme
MRKRISNAGVTVQAVAGNHAVFLGFDLDGAAREGCLGFSIQRTDETEAEEYWLAGFKTFKSVVPNPVAESTYSTRDHPLQTFYWGDYSAKPDHEYSYRIVPRYGTPKNLVNKPGIEPTINVTTNDPARGAHGVYFNRGVAASQAYAYKFGQPPDKLPSEKSAEALTWLSRGLIEALLEFIGQARSAEFALRVAAYEFTQTDVLKALDTASGRGADVKIVYHALDDSTGNTNRDAIAEMGLDSAILIERTKATIAHNKFIVLCHKAASGGLTPVSVWTGSTNFSEGGIYGHSNVGHIVRDQPVGRQYLDFWTELSNDPPLDDLRDWGSAKSAFDPANIATASIQTVFSPRHGTEPLKWYAQRFGAATVSGHITEAFGVTSVIEEALKSHVDDALHYVLLDKRDDKQAEWSASHKVFVAVGSAGGPSTLSRWAKEQLTGFNGFVPYLHTKVLLIDPMSAAPTVISGSANFSPASTNSNDENMLVIPSDTEVADVYFTEFARIFNHFYARWWASQLDTSPAGAETKSFLDETEAWQAPYFRVGNPKQLQRVLYSSGVEANLPD